MSRESGGLFSGFQNGLDMRIQASKLYKLLYFFIEAPTRSGGSPLLQPRVSTRGKKGPRKNGSAVGTTHDPQKTPHG